MDKVLTRLPGETATDVYARAARNDCHRELQLWRIRRTVHPLRDLQDYPNIQCIVLECASNDDSLPVIEAGVSSTIRLRGN